MTHLKLSLKKFQKLVDNQTHLSLIVKHHMPEKLEIALEYLMSKKYGMVNGSKEMERFS